MLLQEFPDVFKAAVNVAHSRAVEAEAETVAKRIKDWAVALHAPATGMYVVDRQANRGFQYVPDRVIGKGIRRMDVTAFRRQRPELYEQCRVPVPRVSVRVPDTVRSAVVSRLHMPPGLEGYAGPVPSRGPGMPGESRLLDDYERVKAVQSAAESSVAVWKPKLSEAVALVVDELAEVYDGGWYVFEDGCKFRLEQVRFQESLALERFPAEAAAYMRCAERRVQGHYRYVERFPDDPEDGDSEELSSMSRAERMRFIS